MGGKAGPSLQEDLKQGWFQLMSVTDHHAGITDLLQGLEELKKAFVLARAGSRAEFSKKPLP